MSFDPENKEHSEVKAFLDRLDIPQHLSRLIHEGFDSIRSLYEITEDDMKSMQIIPEHRQRIQQEIALCEEASAHASPLQASAVHNQSQPGDEQRSDSTSKRKYRRHPERDANAPIKPPSAYIMFSNDMRARLKDQQLSFSELAKITGNEWKSMDGEMKRSYERTAMQAKDEYAVRLDEYSRTPEYNQYQNFLEQFKLHEDARQTDRLGKTPLPRPRWSAPHSSERESFSFTLLEPLSPSSPQRSFIQEKEAVMLRGAIPVDFSDDAPVFHDGINNTKSTTPDDATTMHEPSAPDPSDL